VVTAASLSEAKALLANQPAGQAFDLYLLDLGLPDGDGKSFLELARKEGNAPVIVISARHMRTAKLSCLTQGPMIIW